MTLPAQLSWICTLECEQADSKVGLFVVAQERADGSQQGQAAIMGLGTIWPAR